MPLLLLVGGVCCFAVVLTVLLLYLEAPPQGEAPPPSGQRIHFDVPTPPETTAMARLRRLYPSEREPKAEEHGTRQDERR